MRTTYISWLLVLLASLAWGGVFFLSQYIMQQHDALASILIQAQDASARSATDLKMHAFARDTKASREALDSATRVDLLAAAHLLEQAGSDAHVPVHIGTVTSDPARGRKMIPVVLSLEASGTFAELMRLMSLLGTLPVASTLETASLARSASTDPHDAPWILSTRIRILTAVTDTSL